MKEFLLKIYNAAIFALTFYVSGWLMFIKPLIDIAGCNNITGVMIVGVILKIIFALPVAKVLYAFGLIIALKIFNTY